MPQHTWTAASCFTLARNTCSISRPMPTPRNITILTLPHHHHLLCTSSALLNHTFYIPCLNYYYYHFFDTNESAFHCTINRIHTPQPVEGNRHRVDQTRNKTHTCEQWRSLEDPCELPLGILPNHLCASRCLQHHSSLKLPSIHPLSTFSQSAIP